MNRRRFLLDAGATAAISSVAPRLVLSQDSGQPIAGTLSIAESAPSPFTIPSDFIGLSYESAQLANPAFFSAQNTALITLFRELTDDGVLRLGGGTSEFTAFTTEESLSSPPLDTVGPDTSKNVKSDTPITPKVCATFARFSTLATGAAFTA